MGGSLFTASQIARCVGKSRQAVQRVLSNVPADGLVMVGGNAGNAWRLCSLPAPFQEEISRRAERRLYRNPEQLLRSTGETWPPDHFPAMLEITDACLARAAQLQRALRRMLELNLSPVSTWSDLVRTGLDGYKREFGYHITERHLRDLFNRTLDRDGGANEFHRLVLYLPNNPELKNPQPTAPVPVRAQSDWKDLTAAIASIKDAAKPTAHEKEDLWIRALEALQSKLDAGESEKITRRGLVKFLLRAAPFLAPGEDALRMALNRRRIRWLSKDRDPAAVEDLRSGKSGRYRAPELTEADKRLLTAVGAKFGGGVEQAWDLVKGSLSTEVREYYKDSSRCPRLIREAIRGSVKLEKIALHGRNTSKAAGAYVNRDPNGIKAGDWDQSDDMTMVNVWWEEAPGTPEGFWFGQGQLLVWIDERSWLIYSWDLISDPFYDSFSIRNSWTVKADTWGLPRQGLSLERGIWKTSHLIVGERAPARDETDIPLLETATGLRRLGMRFHNATSARVKVIERIYGMIQNYFQAAPGYVGRNPFVDKYEEVQQKIRLVKAGKAHPSEFFLHKSQWRSILDKVCLHFNEHEMDGKYHEGRSPKQVFEACFGGEQLVKVPEQFRYLLATNKYVRPVTGNGISFKFGKRTFTYKGYELGKHRFSNVIAWFNPERPDTICCTDLDEKNPFIAELEPSVYNHDPIPGTLERAQELNAAQNRYQKELHRSLKPYYHGAFFDNLFRPVIVDRKATELSTQFAAQSAARKSEELERETRTRKMRSQARKLGVPAALVGDDDQSQQAIELFNQAYQERDSEARHEVQAKHVYQLDENKMFAPKSKPESQESDAQ